MAIMSPPDQQIAIRLAEQPSGYLPGASVRILSGDAAGRQLFVTGVFGDTLLLDGFGADGNAKADGVRSGDQVEVDNDAYLGYRSEEHTSELQSLMRISYAVFCLKKKKTTTIHNNKKQRQTLNVTNV